MRILVSIIIFIICLPVSSQTWEAVINNPAYIYGEGWGVTVAEADKQALNDLISKISVHVEGNVTVTENEEIKNGSVNATTQFNSVVNTYSQTTLHNTQKVVIKNEPDAHVGRWIKRSDINKIFESRKNKIKDYVNSAVKAEKAAKLDVALKDYYWALSLLKSLQNPNELTYHTDTGDDVILMNWIPRQMNDIFNNLTTSVSKRNGEDIEISILYKGMPVNSIDYTYFDGRDWGNIYSAKDGVGVLELAPGNESNDLQIKFEYEYRGESHIDKDVEDVLKAFPPISMRNAYQSFKSYEQPVLEANKKNSVSEASRADKRTDTIKQIAPDEIKKENLNAVLRSIGNKNYDNVKDLFTPYGFDIYEKLLKYGRARIVGEPDIKFFSSNGSTIAKGIQMSFSFSQGARKSFVEDLVFTFNDEGLIDNISFGLGKIAENDIMTKGAWMENARFALMNFLENYQTAYALKRLDYIETIFDDDAVIITGQVVHRNGNVLSGDVSGIQFGGDIIKYNRHTKDSYLRELKRSFAGKEFINLRLADNEIRKLGKGGEMYAIQISQEYYSSNYGDKGYLFLIIDLNDPVSPIIKVRTWQPEKDPDFGIYGPEDFM